MYASKGVLLQYCRPGEVIFSQASKDPGCLTD